LGHDLGLEGYGLSLDGCVLAFTVLVPSLNNSFKKRECPNIVYIYYRTRLNQVFNSAQLMQKCQVEGTKLFSTYQLIFTVSVRQPCHQHSDFFPTITSIYSTLIPALGRAPCRRYREQTS